jgi:hypothetical protein
MRTRMTHGQRRCVQPEMRLRRCGTTSMMDATTQRQRRERMRSTSSGVLLPLVLERALDDAHPARIARTAYKPFRPTSFGTVSKVPPPIVPKLGMTKDFTKLNAEGRAAGAAAGGSATA